jgi:Questin oxidase-like
MHSSILTTILRMHLITSSLFLPPVAAYFPPHAIQLLLRLYFATILATWITKGRPTIHIKEFMASTSSSPQEPIKSRSKPAKDTFTPDNVTPNPWLAIIQSVVEHPVDHLTKLQRTLMHWANLFGSRPAGYLAGGKEQLDDIELIDGTLFIRVAGATMDKLGWMREGQERGAWHVGVLA